MERATTEHTVTIPYLLQHMAAMMMRQSDQVLQERLGIGMSQLRILLALEHEPKIRQRALAERLGQTEASISRQIKLMSEKGFLAALVNPKSRREHVTVPTAKGIKIAEAANEVLISHYKPMLDLVGEKQKRQFADTLAAFHGHTCAAGKPFACDNPGDS